MDVDTILSIKGRRVATIEPSRTLAEAARALSDMKIGALLVSDGNHPVVGIISERDIVRAVAAHGSGALDQAISFFMTEKVVTCTGRTAVTAVMEAMTEGKFRHIPVLEHGEVAGIVSIGDVVKHRLAEIEAEAQAIKDYIATA
ncbi:CBS domain-containing protein [Microvirga terricola]|uniref:CBS domain-containing protein n=1 Tax=Microvirga terricola TaxID=2719797 RepID=A0ABX0VA72_9HYPH|nr:CBS domain-containing protein [Microvirga terricola]NIX76603.1 CBS domain-containing protein [Microvirga terricola]